MEKIKILHITQSLGGVETYIRQIISTIDRSKYEIVLVSPFNKELSNFCLSNGVKIYCIKMDRGLNIFVDLQNLFSFCKIIRDENPDLVHLHSSKAGFIGRLACRIKHKKSIFTPHGLSYLSFTGVKRMIFFMLEVIAKSFTFRVLACSNSEAYRMIFELGMEKSHIDVELNSIMLNKLETIEEPSFSNSDKFRIGTISRLTYQKNPLLLVEIASQIISKYPNTEFSILGAGLEDHLKDNVIKRIKDLGIENQFKILNWGAHDNSISYLKQLDIFILPSIFEGLPLSLLEAMAIGLPVVTSKCDGCNDVIQNNINGYNAITVNEFVDALINLIEKEDIRKRIGLRGREYVFKNHNMELYIKKLENYYSNVLAN